MKKTTLVCVLTLLFSMLAGGSLVIAAPASYTVQSGDCLWNIASSNGVSVDQIKQLNGLSSELLQVGQVLKLSTAAAPAASSPAAATTNTSSYVVQSGDNLWGIASAHGITLEQIKQLNGMSSDLLQIGQVLKLAGVSTPAPTPATPPPASAPAPAGVSSYVIQPGDSLWSIAQLYGTTADNLKALNGLTGDALFAGDTLKVAGTPAEVSVSRSGDIASGSRVVAKAAQYLGTPYRYGGSAPGGFDCSGFTSYVFKQFGISLSRTAAGQYGQGIAVSKANLIAGDLVFFNTYGGVSHVGIYAGGGRFIHSSSPNSGGVIYSAMSESYYASRYVGARRILR
ncbi:MAG: LysM peptidoglycan-binding domain-containing protein [Syntrophomonadaceae bacterium]